MSKKYVWLDINTGKFSDSWTEWDSPYFTEKYSSEIQEAATRGKKLISYECLNDESFSFYDLMKITTNTTKNNHG